jgi:murein DD-endopeptidase MepM/ murein hydrolase activator NlpD
LRRSRRAFAAAFLAATLSSAFPRAAAAVAPPGGGSLSVAVDRSGPLQGDVVRVELRGTPPPDNAAIHWKGRAWPMRACGEGCYEALAGIDVAEAPGRHTLAVLASRSGSALRADVELEVAERPFPLQSFTVPKEKDAQDPLLLERIAEEARALRDRFDAPPSAPAWASPFAPPVPGFAPRNFGNRRVINDEPRAPHTGGDMTLPEGTPVSAVADGRVVFSGEQFFGGNEVVVDHGGGLFSMYFHLSERAVGEGQAVRRGERIGAVGATGRATGPHLHFGLRVTGARVDPAALPGVVDNR